MDFRHIGQVEWCIIHFSMHLLWYLCWQASVSSSSSLSSSWEERGSKQILHIIIFFDVYSYLYYQSISNVVVFILFFLDTDKRHGVIIIVIGGTTGCNHSDGPYLGGGIGRGRVGIGCIHKTVCIARRALYDGEWMMTNTWCGRIGCVRSATPIHLKKTAVLEEYGQ